MILYFQNSRGKVKRVGHIDGRMSCEKIAAEINRQIYAYCEARHFKIYYMRVWNEDLNGKPMTKFDVGSHTEFFYTYPQSYDLFQQYAQTQKECDV